MPVVAAKKELVKKAWFQVVAPQFLGGQIVAETMAAKPKDIVGRTLLVPLNEITGNVRQYQTQLRLRISSVAEDNAQTEYYGQDVLSDVVARIIRRWSSRVDVVVPVNTADGKKLRVKVLAVTARRVNSTLQSEVRKVIMKNFASWAAGKTLEQIVLELNFGKLPRVTLAAAKKVYPVRTLEIRAIEVL